MKISLLLALQTLCLLASGQPPRTAPAQVPATTTVSTVATPALNPSWVIKKRADDTDTGDSAATDDSADDTETAEDTAAEETTAEETTAEQTTAETTAEETTASETTAETTSETSSSTSETSSETTSTTSSSSSSSTSSSSTSSTSSASATSTITPEQAHRNHVGNIAAIATFSSLGFIILVVFLALVIRKRVLAKKKEDQKALLQAGTSAYSMVPVAENPSANASEVRLSMMFATEPRVPGQEQEQGQEQGQEQRVHASPPFLSPQQRQQFRSSRLSQQYPRQI